MKNSRDSRFPLKVNNSKSLVEAITKAALMPIKSALSTLVSACGMNAKIMYKREQQLGSGICLKEWPVIQPEAETPSAIDDHQNGHADGEDLQTFHHTAKKKPSLQRAFKKKRVHLAILTPSSPGTTFAATELDFRVRDVTGYFLSAIDTPKLLFTNLG